MAHTEDEILAVYVRAKYPGIEENMDYGLYRFVVRVSDAVAGITAQLSAAVDRAKE